MAQTRRKRSAGRRGRDDISTPGRAPARSEWLVAGLGALLMLGAIGQLLYTALGRDEAPPDIRLAAEQVIELEQGYLVLFRARNRGRSAAAEVEVEGELDTPDGSVETSTMTFDYLPPGSDREGGLMFTRDPRMGRLQLRPKAFAMP